MFADTTDIEVINSKLGWKINNINRLTKLTRCGDYKSSCAFYSPKIPSIIWKLRIYPNGYHGVSPGDVYISLIRVGLKNEDESVVRAAYYFNALQTSGINKEIGRFTEDFKNMSESIRLNINMLNSLLADGSIKIICEVEYLLPEKMDCNENDNSYIINIYKNILLKEKFPDCVIQIGSNLIKAHRCVLVENSEVFNLMFEQNDMSEAQTGIVKISDCSSETFKGMLEFCYTGNVSESTMEDLCVDIFAISHKYQITNLKIKCEQFMASTIDKDNFVQYCRIIELYGSSILEEACVKYIVANREEFLKKDEGWKNLKSTFPCLTHRLLEKLIAEIDK